MHSYVILTRFTRTGIENVEESPGRTEDAVAMIESLGGELREFFVVMGRYDGVLASVSERGLVGTSSDGVLIADFPDDETAARATLGKSGNVTTETLKAIGFGAFRDIVTHAERVH